MQSRLADGGRVLVTGGAGFIGTALVRALRARGQPVTAIDDYSARGRPPLDAEDCVFGNVADPTFLARILGSRPGIAAIVHLAGRVGVRRVLANPRGCRDANVAMATSLAESLTAQKGASSRRPRVFAASTSEVYELRGGTMSETDPVRAESSSGRWAYAASKIESERILDASGLWDAGRAPVHLRFFNVVGPGQDASSGMVLPSFIEAARAGRPLVVHGDGSHVRTLAHVDDVAETLCALLVHPGVPGGPLNVGGRARASVMEIARAVERAAGRPLDIRCVDPRDLLGPAFEDVRWREPDLGKLESLGVPVPSRSLDEIVADAWARHPWPPRADHAESARMPACASPAS